MYLFLFFQVLLCYLIFDDTTDLANNTVPQSIGVVTVYMVRPWSASQFLSVILKSTKIHILDLTSEEFVSSPPVLFLDVACSFHSNSEALVNSSVPELVSMKYKGTSLFVRACLY